MIDNKDGRIFVYPAEFDAENEQEYINFQRWCREDGREEPSWPPKENADSKDEPKNQRDDENDSESNDKSDDESGDESDDDDDWYPEQYQVASNPLPAEATISRPLVYLCFRMGQKGYMMDSLLKGMQSAFNKRGKASALKEAVLNKIQSNRKLLRIASLLKGTSFLVRVSVPQSSVPVYRDIRVPSNMNLRMFQTRVLCPVFDWDSTRMPKKYIYYLPHTCYPSQRRPLSTFKDIVFTMPCQHDYMGMMMAKNHTATDAEVIDDSDVCLADFLQEVGHTLYYQHNLTIPMTLQLRLLEISQEDVDSVGLVGGTGINPPEDNLITECRFPEREFIGIDAFNLAIKWLQSVTIHESYKKEGKRLLQIKDSDTFDPTKCDLFGARKRLDRSIRHSTARTHLPKSAELAMTLLFTGNPGAMKNLPAVHWLGMCKTCLKENVKLLTCGRCKSVFYCSKDCQKKDWKTHKTVCARC